MIVDNPAYEPPVVDGGGEGGPVADGDSVRAIADYEYADAGSGKFVALREGHFYDILSTDAGGGWWRVRSADGAEGLAPSNFLADGSSSA